MRFAMMLLCICISSSVFGAELHEHPTLVEMFNENNSARERNGRGKQTLSPELVKAAQDHAWYMAKQRHLSHGTNGGPFARTVRHRYTGSYRGEIIAMGQGSVSSVFNTWLNSTGHRNILLSGNTEAGFGYAQADGGATYWVGIYGVPGGPTTSATISSGKSSNYTSAGRRRLFRRR